MADRESRHRYYEAAWLAYTFSVLTLAFGASQNAPEGWRRVLTALLILVAGASGAAAFQYIRIRRILGAAGLVALVAAFPMALLPKAASNPSAVNAQAPPLGSARISPGKSFVLALQVHSSQGWKSNLITGPSRPILFQVAYKNASRQIQRNVVLKIVLPSEILYTPNSSRLTNGSNPDPLKVSDGLISDTGINIGDYNPGAAAYVLFSAEITTAEDFLCDPRTLAPRAVGLAGGAAQGSEVVIRVAKRDC